MNNYLIEIDNLRKKVKDNEIQSSLLAALRTSLSAVSTSSEKNARMSVKDLNYAYVEKIRLYTYTLQSYLYNINYASDTKDIKSLIIELNAILPESPSRNTLSNVLSSIDKNEPITFFNNVKVLNALKTKYGTALDIATADDLIRQFIKKNTSK